jgi:alpha-amylase/alpha-mannosidase (GH57 family)
VIASSWVLSGLDIAQTACGMNSKIQLGEEKMWRKLIQMRPRIVEIFNRSGHRQVVSLDEYRDKMIARNHERVRQAFYGIHSYREPYHLIEHLRER